MTFRGPRRPHVVPITAPSFPTLPRPQIYRKIAYTFVALTVVVLVGVLWLSSVKADVTVVVKRNPVKFDGVVDVAKTARSGQIPGRVVQGIFATNQEFDVKALAAVSSTASASSTSVPSVQVVEPPPTAPVSDSQVRARGTVRIINKYSKSQTLVKTTRLLTADEKLYRIDKNITVPAGGEVSVSVYADKMGSEFAIPPTRFTIPGLYVDLQKYIYAVSDTSFVAVKETAGAKIETSEPVKKVVAPKTGIVVTAEMVDRAQKQLMNSVLDQAKKTLATEVVDPKFGEAVYYVKLLEKGHSATLGQVATSFIASIRLDVTAVYYAKDDMSALVRAKLKERIPDGREFLPFDEANIVYSLDATDAKNETASIHVIADGAYRLNSSNALLQKALIAGKSKEDAITILRAVDGVQDVRVEMHPKWVSKIPSLKDHINLKIE